MRRQRHPGRADGNVRGTKLQDQSGCDSQFVAHAPPHLMFRRPTVGSGSNGATCRPTCVEVSRRRMFTRELQPPSAFCRNGLIDVFFGQLDFGTVSTWPCQIDYYTNNFTNQYGSRGGVGGSRRHGSDGGRSAVVYVILSDPKCHRTHSVRPPPELTRTLLYIAIRLPSASHFTSLHSRCDLAV